MYVCMYAFMGMRERNNLCNYYSFDVFDSFMCIMSF